VNFLEPVEQNLLDGPEKKKHREDQAGREDRRHIKAETDGHPDRSHNPDRGGCREAVDLVALPQDGPGAEEANSRHDLGGDSRWVCGTAKSLEPQPRKQARADSDEAQGFDPGRVAVELTLETDGDRE